MYTVLINDKISYEHEGYGCALVAFNIKTLQSIDGKGVWNPAIQHATLILKDNDSIKYIHIPDCENHFTDKYNDLYCPCTIGCSHVRKVYTQADISRFDR
jgi:hypothetical protein